MAGKNNFPTNSTIICNKWGFNTNSVADIRWNKTGYLKGRNGRFWKLYGSGRKEDPKFHWDKAIQTMVYIQNRIRDKVLAHKQYFGRKPNLQHLRIFDNIAYVHVPNEKRRKLDLKSEKYILVG